MLARYVNKGIERRTLLPTLNDTPRISIHLGNYRRDTQEGAVGRASVFVDLEVICVEEIPWEAWDTSRCLFHNLRT